MNNENLVLEENHPNDSYLFAHHLIDDPYIPKSSPIFYFYFNFFAESQSTVDQSQLTGLANGQMGAAMMKTSLQQSGSLGGLMTGMGISAPSPEALMICLGLINIEMPSARIYSNFQQTVVAGISDQPTSVDAIVDTTYKKDKSYYFRQFSLDKPNTDLDRIYLSKKWLFNSVGKFLGTILLFDEMRKRMPSSDSKYPRYYQQLNVAFNISSTVFHEIVNEPMTYFRSFANQMCPVLAQTGYTKCLQERGSYQNMKQWATPVNSYNKNAHNVLFRRSFPRFDSKRVTTTNNWTALCYRYLFHSQFSNLLTHTTFSTLLRSIGNSHETFKDYIFDLNIDDTFDDIPTIIHKIGQDSITTLTSNLQKKDSGNDYNPLLFYVYEELVKTAKTVFRWLAEYLDIMRISNPCAFRGEYPLNGYDTQVYDKRIRSINSIIIPSQYATEDIGSLTSHYSNDKEISETIGYKLLAPVTASCVDNGNLVAGFITFPAQTAGNMQIRQYGIKQVYHDKLTDIINMLESGFDWDLFLGEVYQPHQEWQNLLLWSENMGGSNDCIKNYLQIPSILSEIIPEQKNRGVFIKN